MAYYVDMRLSDVNSGNSVVLKNMCLESKVASYLKNLGVVPGTVMKILLNSINGVVIFVRNGKIAIDRDVAKALEVNLLWREDAPVAMDARAAGMTRRT